MASGYSVVTTAQQADDGRAVFRKVMRDAKIKFE
jgi:hypothetical protein